MRESLTLRNAIFQLHWFFGITAGLVLAVVGATGGVLSFEDELLKALNPGVMTVQPRDQALTPAALVDRVREQRPDAGIASLQLSDDPRDTAVIGFVAKDGGRRGERVHVDPYDGQLLPEPRYQGFFRTTMQLHRWLVMDDIGKQIVGASTAILLFFCVSGIYLRWPRRWFSLRTWLALDWRQKGRNFLWHLHSVVGTWVLLAYLVMALTGLWWSYDWYRTAVNDWAGKQEIVKVPADAGRGPPPDMDIDAAWQAFNATAPAWNSATLAWPKQDEQSISFRYMDADPAHERARNELQLDRWTLDVAGHARYDDATWRQQIGASIFALHRGSYFGTPGVVVFMLASLLMPLFTITGWMLYLDRRRKQRVTKALRRPSAAGAGANALGGAITVVHASQTGTAERIAWQTAALLREAGEAVEVMPLGRVDLATLPGRGRVLFITSTFGDGEAPDSARAFARRLRATKVELDRLQYAVLALGDREYGDHFCGFGRELDQRLQHAGAQVLFDRVEVDGDDPASLRHWQHHVGQLAGRNDLPDWETPRYQRWQLNERHLLNPGSAGGPAFHVVFSPDDVAHMRWQAGDIAEIGPRNAVDDVERWATQVGLDITTSVEHGAGTQVMRDLLARSHLPLVDAARGQSPESIARTLRPLAHREYSIASLPSDGSLHLLVRQMRDSDGRLGSGSGWLTAHADIGENIDLRIRSNPSFHPPVDDRPLLLIGNGTGLAGLRALLKARIAAGHRNNWLLFGERNAAHDAFHDTELRAWLDNGDLQRLDRVYSRDQDERRYVQHALVGMADLVLRWLGDNGAVYVCGSLEGMAPGVDEALGDFLGIETLEAMAADGRYRRDVY